MQRAHRSSGKWSSAAGMQQPDDPLHRIDEVDRTTIRHVDSETYPGARGDEAIDRGHWHRRSLIHDCHFTPVHLLADEEVASRKTGFLPRVAMKKLQPLQRLLAVDLDIETGHTAQEGMRDTRHGFKRGKFFHRQQRAHSRLSSAHFFFFFGAGVGVGFCEVVTTV